MSWFVFALAAGVASAVNVWASKVLVTRDLKPVTVGGAVHLWAGLLCLVAAPFVSLRAELTPQIFLGVLGMGFVYVLGNALYFTALKKAELSEIDLFLRTTSLWTFLFGVMLLGEDAASQTILGAALVVGAVLLLSNQERRIRFDRAGLLALGAALAFGAGNVADKALSPAFDALSYTVVNLLLTGFGMLLVARARPSDPPRPRTARRDRALRRRDGRAHAASHHPGVHGRGRSGRGYPGCSRQVADPACGGRRDL